MIKTWSTLMSTSPLQNCLSANRFNKDKNVMLQTTEQ